jgi:hypothetical protein
VHRPAPPEEIAADMHVQAREIRRWFTTTTRTPRPEASAELRRHLDDYVTLLGKFADVARSERA